MHWFENREVKYTHRRICLMCSVADECRRNHRECERRRKEIWNLVQWKRGSLHYSGEGQNKTWKSVFVIWIFSHVRTCLFLAFLDIVCMSFVCTARFDFQINSKSRLRPGMHKQHTHTAPHHHLHVSKLLATLDLFFCWTTGGHCWLSGCCSESLNRFAFSHRPPPWTWRTRGCPRSGKYWRANWRRAKVCFSHEVSGVTRPHIVTQFSQSLIHITAHRLEEVITEVDAVGCGEGSDHSCFLLISLLGWNIRIYHWPRFRTVFALQSM